jgi:hypothetical protein
MTVFNSAYDTTVGSAVNVLKIQQAIKESFIHDMIYLNDLDLCTDFSYRPVFVLGKTASESNIPLFNHPLLLNTSSNLKYICSDMRQIVRANSEDGLENGIEIKNKTEYTLNKARTAINMLWVSGRTLEIKNAFPLAGFVFSNWLSGSLTRRFALDPKDQLILSVISHLYYQNLFFTGNTLTEDKKQQFVIQTTKATRATPEFIFPILDQIETIGTINEYCDTVKKIIQNPRLSSLNSGLLITIIGNSWYGLNAKEMLAVALEHPPTWITLVYMAIFEKTYRHSALTKISETFGKGKGTKEYILSFNALLEESGIS